MGVAISQLPAAGPLTGAELFPLVQGGLTKQTTLRSLGPAVNVQAYGAKGDGVTDDTAAFNAAHTAAAAINSAVYIPGTTAGYRLAGTVTVKASMFGDGPNTALITSSATADILQCAVSHVILADFQLTSSVPRTAGSYINFIGSANNNQDCRVNRILMGNWYNGIIIQGGGSTGIRLEDLTLETNVAGGTGITLSTTNNAADVVVSDTLILGPTSGSQCANGLLVLNVGDLTLQRVLTVKTGNGLSLKPGAGQTIQLVVVSDSQFDSGSGQGINIDPAATATIELVKVCNSWVCTNANGVVIDPDNTGTTTRVELINVTASNNTGQGILTQAGGTASHLVIQGGSASANTNGVYIGGSTTGVIIEGATCGACGQFSGNSSSGIVIEALVDDFVITGNDLRGNTASAISDATSPATTRIIRSNLGFTTENSGTGAIASGTTTITITHGLTRTPTLQNISIIGTNNPSNDPGNLWVDTLTSTQFNVNCRSNPGVSTLTFGWQAVII